MSIAEFLAAPPADGHSTHTKKQEMNPTVAERAERYRIRRPLADRADTYLNNRQPGRVPLGMITWHPLNRGGYHCHDVALDVTEHGTSKRQYNQVRLVEVPDSAIPEVLAENREKADLDPLLSNFDAIRHNNPVNGSNIAT